MSIASQIQRIKSNIALSYDAVAGKGGQLPQTQNSANLPQAIATIPQGSENNGDYLVQVIDYDGKILKEARLFKGETFRLPDPPTNHPRLRFQTWSSSAPIVDNKVTVTNNDILIGPIYDTVSGLTEFDIYVPPSAVGVAGRFAVSGTKDWGDGTSNTEGRHTYSQSGFYTIKVNCTSFGGGQYNGVFIQYNYNSPVFRCLGVHCSSNVRSLGAYTLMKTWCKFFTLANGITTLPEYLNVSTQVTCLIIPPSITSISNNFSRGYRRNKVVLPYGLTSIGDYSFNQTRVELMPIPDTCTTLGTNFMQENTMKTIRVPEGVTVLPACRSIVPYEVIMPDTLTKCTDFFDTPVYKIVAGRDFAEIGDGTFTYTSMNEWDFTKCNQVPTLASTNVDVGGVIKVPAALYDQWITETNWVDLADYIVPV